MIVKKYGIVTSDNGLEFKETVNTMIADGWQPIGGVSISACMVPDQYEVPQEVIYLAQGMARYEE